MQQKTWKDAVLDVLRSTEGSLHYEDDILAEIKKRKLRTGFGKSPRVSVAVALTDLLRCGAVLKDRPGYYSIKQEEPEETDEETPALKIEAYGLFWKADEVEWRTGKRQLRGVDPNDDTLIVNFASQEGVYLLHHHNTPTAVYVGMTSRRDNGLYDRLVEHQKDQTQGRWETFSWFGFRPVLESRKLGNPATTVERRRMIEIVEAILIETILPALNRQFGRRLGKKYEQAPKPRRR